MVPQYDEPLEQLRVRQPTAAEPSDLDDFWADTLAQSRAVWWEPMARPIDAGIPVIEIFDVAFAGFGGEPIRAWYRRPAGVSEDLPVVIQYPGYGGGRALPHQVHPWVLAGYAELVIDVRGQGGLHGWVGDTADSSVSGPTTPGFMTRGIEDPANLYLRRLLTDGVLAVDAARQLPGVDGSNVVLSGTSQGAGLALGTAALEPNVAAVMANVPFLCDFPRSVALASEGPYLEIAMFLASHRWRVESTFATLAYVDMALLASRATAPAYFSVALADTTCPPSGVFAAYNSYRGAKEISVYPYNNHEGGQFHQEAVQLAWLPKVLAARSSDA